MSKIKHIEIGLENCEVVRFDGNDVTECCIFDVVSDKNKRPTAGLVHLLVSPNANTEDSFVTEWSLDIKGIEGIEDTSPFARLMRFRDIVDVKVEYIDGKTTKVCVDWDDNSEYDNSLQFTRISGQGELAISIGKDYKNKY